MGAFYPQRPAGPRKHRPVASLPQVLPPHKRPAALPGPPPRLELGPVPEALFQPGLSPLLSVENRRLTLFLHPQSGPGCPPQAASESLGFGWPALGAGMWRSRSQKGRRDPASHRDRSGSRRPAVGRLAARRSPRSAPPVVCSQFSFRHSPHTD